MVPLQFSDAVQRVLERDDRYTIEAYELVRHTLSRAVEMFRKGDDDQHVTGQELLAGLRDYMLKEYGPMSRLLLSLWGLNRGEDVGNLVYNLIDIGYFGRNEGDSIEDFSGGYDFDRAFSEPFLPSSAISRAES